MSTTRDALAAGGRYSAPKPVYGSAAEIGREIAATWDRIDRANEAATAATSPATRRFWRRMESATFEAKETLHEVLADTPARSVDDALAQAAIAHGLMDAIMGSTYAPGLKEREERMVHKLTASVARFLMSQTSTDPRMLGAAAYMHELVDGGVA